MKSKVSQAEGSALDWLVAKCEGFAYEPSTYVSNRPFCYYINGTRGGCESFWPSTNPAQAYPIIYREDICVHATGDANKWKAYRWDATIVNFTREQYGPTPLIAAMRCYVASKLGDEVEIPEEL